MRSEQGKHSNPQKTVQDRVPLRTREQISVKKNAEYFDELLGYNTGGLLLE